MKTKKKNRIDVNVLMEYLSKYNKCPFIDNFIRKQ